MIGENRWYMPFRGMDIANVRYRFVEAPVLKIGAKNIFCRRRKKVRFRFPFPVFLHFSSPVLPTVNDSNGFGKIYP